MEGRRFKEEVRGSDCRMEGREEEKRREEKRGNWGSSLRKSKAAGPGSVQELFC